jgi:hypothetical protein
MAVEKWQKMTNDHYIMIIWWLHDDDQWWNLLRNGYMMDQKHPKALYSHLSYGAACDSYLVGFQKCRILSALLRCQAVPYRHPAALPKPRIW